MRSDKLAWWKPALWVLFLLMWLDNLVGTDSRYSVYAFSAVVGLLCMVDVLFRGGELSARERMWTDLFAAFFSAAVILANYRLFEIPSLITLVDVCCTFLGGFFVARSVLRCALNHLPVDVSMEDSRKKESVLTPKHVFFLTFASVAAIDLLYLLLVQYPGAMTRDSVSTIRQILGDSAYNNTMPFWHTVTVAPFIRLGLTLFDDINAAVALFHVAQILFMAACFGCVTVTLYQIGVPKPVLLGVYAVYAFMPYNIVYSVTLWKDVPFSGAALLFVTGFYRLLKNVGRSRKLNYGIFLAGALGFSLWRTNGWYAFFAVVLVMLLLLRKREKKLLLIMCVVLVFCWVLINPVLDAIGVGETDLVEVFAVPMQQIARIVAEGRPLDQEETNLLSAAFHLDKMAELYDPQIVDPVKFQTFRYEQTGYVAENLGSYLKLYVKLGLKYPGDYLKAWIDETRGYWNGGYDYWMYTQDVVRSDYGIAKSGGNAAFVRLFASAFRLLEEPKIMELFSSVGLYVWGLIGCCLINVLKKREEFLLTIPMLVLILGLWIGTPVFCEFRYAYPVILTMPLILCVTVYRKKS